MFKQKQHLYYLMMKIKLKYYHLGWPATMSNQSHQEDLMKQVCATQKAIWFKPYEEQSCTKHLLFPFRTDYIRQTQKFTYHSVTSMKYRKQIRTNNHQQFKRITVAIHNQQKASLSSQGRRQRKCRWCQTEYQTKCDNHLIWNDIQGHQRYNFYHKHIYTSTYI